MYGYVYLTTNIVNGKKYIGRHKSSKYDARYKGSGKIIRQAIKRYGRDKFITIVLSEYEDEKSLNQGEIYWIAKYDAVNSDEFYNIEKGGYANGRPVGFKVTRESVERVANKLRGRKLSDDTRLKISLSLKGINAGENNPAKRDDVRAKFRLINAGKNNPVWGKHWYNNGVTDILAEICPEGFVHGRLFKETKFKNRCHWYNNGIKSIKAEFCPDGYTPGRLKGIVQ